MVARKPSGVPFDHLTETLEAMQGAKEHVKRLLKFLSDPDLTPEQRAIIQAELSELSKMLDQARRILGE